MPFSQISWASVLSSATWMNIVSFFPFLVLLALIVLQVGNDTSTIPPTVISYLAALRSRFGSKPLRIRIGGNSMDSSIYVPSQTSPMVQPIGVAANDNDQPVNYSSILWDVMDQVSSDIGGASILLGLYFFHLMPPSPLQSNKRVVGLSLLDPNSTNVPLLAGIFLFPGSLVKNLISAFHRWCSSKAG